MDSDARRTAQLIHQRYEDTSLVIFRQAQKKLKRELAYVTVGSSDVSGASVPEAGADRDEAAISSNRRGSRSKAARSAICVLL